MPTPSVSIIIPVRNESGRVQKTISEFIANRQTDHPIEFVIVDDASADGCCEDIDIDENSVSLNVIRSENRLGVPRARNRGASAATSELLFMTDSHVQPSDGWDQALYETTKDSRIVAATITDQKSEFAAHGCNLVVPFMGTHWNRRNLATGDPVQISSCAGTVIPRSLFEHIGKYDEGMKYYGGAEPEFSVRAWLTGAEIVANPSLRIAHRFKNRYERETFISETRPFMIHNNIRFGFLYLNELACLQMVRHYTQLFPNEVEEAMKMVAGSDVWERRDALATSLKYDFDWFIERFDLRDQIGNQIIGSKPS
ncbi:glycosyltransferase [Halalkalicoccus ordinarius]|uniref:glycosyltransferase n=1 Tax=Halalkalicoccus ordinarius TaxID=3116651 RepID=UPI00300EC273